MRGVCEVTAIAEIDSPLTAEESKELERLEDVVSRHQQGFVEVGDALGRIRDDRLYRKTHKTFEAYCRERWGLSRSYADRTVVAAEVAKMLPIGSTMVMTESRARELVPLKGDPKRLQAAIERAQSFTSVGCKVTAQRLRDAVFDVTKQERVTAKRAATIARKENHQPVPVRQIVDLPDEEAARHVLCRIDTPEHFLEDARTELSKAFLRRLAVHIGDAIGGKA